MSEAAAIAIIVVAVASCTVAEKYLVAQPTPEQICVKAAWTQADRIECMKAKQ